jgi:phosphoglycerate kinase
MIPALKGIKTIEDLDVTGKTVFVRLDLNVPLKDGVIRDETRLRESLPTIQYLLQHQAKIILASHLGRPKRNPQNPEFQDLSYSLEPVGEKLAELLNTEILLAQDHSLDFMKPILSGLKNQIILLENLRFQEGETENSEILARQWASYTDVYINDAFGASHRAHASIEALPKLVKTKGCGFLIKKELEMLGRLLDAPEKPFLAILGGSKVSDKINLIENLINRVDGILIGGAMAYTFLKAQGHDVGRSLVESSQLHYARELIQRFEARNKLFLLPTDHVCAANPQDTQPIEITSGNTIPSHLLGVDIGPDSRSRFKSAIQKAHTLFWNGPMGIFETEAFSKGTFSVAQAMAQRTEAFRVVGGGDSVAAVTQAGVTSSMDHISTGGGASLEFIQGDRLPGIEALRERIRS